MQTFFVIRVAPRSELKFLKNAQDLLGAAEGEIFFPRRKLTVVRKGKRIEEETALFPGYLFLKIDGIPPELYWELKGLSGFLNFLRQGSEFSKLSGHDLELLKHFLNFGEVIGPSSVIFDVNNRIKVVRGPMEGLEGHVIRVDRRKGRARIRLDFQHSVFTIDLPFEDLTIQEAPAHEV